MALKRHLNPEKGRVRRSKEGPIWDSPCIKPMPFEKSFFSRWFSPDQEPGDIFDLKGEKEWRDQT
jgi:hypothetical protein